MTSTRMELISQKSQALHFSAGEKPTGISNFSFCSHLKRQKLFNNHQAYNSQGNQGKYQREQNSQPRRYLLGAAVNRTLHLSALLTSERCFHHPRGRKKEKREELNSDYLGQIKICFSRHNNLTKFALTKWHNRYYK